MVQSERGEGDSCVMGGRGVRVVAWEERCSFVIRRSWGGDIAQTAALGALVRLEPRSMRVEKEGAQCQRRYFKYKS